MAFDQLLEECLAAVPDRAAEKKRWRAELGITEGIVSKYIAGKHVPRDKWAAEWARVLDRPPEDVARAFYISRSGSAARAVPEHDHPELQGMIDQLFSLYRQLAGLSTASGHTGGRGRGATVAVGPDLVPQEPELDELVVRVGYRCEVPAEFGLLLGDACLLAADLVGQAEYESFDLGFDVVVVHPHAPESPALPPDGGDGYLIAQPE